MKLNLAAISPEMFGTKAKVPFDPLVHTPDDPNDYTKMVRPIGNYGWGGLASIGEGLANRMFLDRADQARAEGRQSQEASNKILQGVMANPDGATPLALMGHPATRPLAMQMYADAQRSKREEARDDRTYGRQVTLAEMQATKQAELMREQNRLGLEDPLRKAQTEKAQEETNKLRMQQDDPMDIMRRAAVEQYMRENGMEVPKKPGAALSPSPSQPGPRLIPQSAPGMPQQDGQLIQAQAPGATEAAPRPKQPMVNIPGIPVPLPLNIAEAELAKAARDKNQPLYDMISQAIGKVPKALQDDIGKKQIESIDQIARLEGIRERYKPEWQTWETGLKQRGLNILDSFDTLRGQISPEETQTMVDYSTFKMEAYENLNRYIKEMTGAAMGEAEADRLRKAVPDPDKDGPTQFKSKLENAVRLAKLTHARYTAMASMGLSKYTPIDAIPSIMNKRGNEIEKQLRQANPQAPQPMIDQAVRQGIKREFGI